MKFWADAIRIKIGNTSKIPFFSTKEFVGLLCFLVTMIANPLIKIYLTNIFPI